MTEEFYRKLQEVAEKRSQTVSSLVLEILQDALPEIKANPTKPDRMSKVEQGLDKAIARIAKLEQSVNQLKGMKLVKPASTKSKFSSGDMVRLNYKPLPKIHAGHKGELGKLVSNNPDGWTVRLTNGKEIRIEEKYFVPQ